MLTQSQRSRQVYRGETRGIGCIRIEDWIDSAKTFALAPYQRIPYVP